MITEAVKNKRMNSVLRAHRGLLLGSNLFDVIDYELIKGLIKDHDHEIPIVLVEMDVRRRHHISI